MDALLNTIKWVNWVIASLIVLSMLAAVILSGMANRFALGEIIVNVVVCSILFLPGLAIHLWQKYKQKA